MKGKAYRVWGFCLIILLTGIFTQVGLGQSSIELKDIQVSPLENGIRFHLELPSEQKFTQVNLEYWNGQIFEEPERFKTNCSFEVKPGQNSLDFDIKDDPRIELNKKYLSFVLYYHFRLKDKNGNIYETPEMVYYIQRTWYIQPAGTITFFAQRRNAYWDKLPKIAETITQTVDQLYGLKQKKVFILLYKNNYALSHDTGMPNWAAALFSYNIWMRDYNTETRFIAEMAHEYTHYLQYENESRIPLFFMEGMSDYTYFKLAPRERPDLSLYRSYIDKKVFLDSNQMFGEYPKETKYVNSFYKQSYLFVQYVADKLGPDKFKTFIQALNSKALDQVVADTPEFAKKGIYGMWMEIRDQASKAKSRPIFLKDEKLPAGISQVNEGWKNVWGLSFSTDSKKIAVGRFETDKNDNPTSTKLQIVDLSSGKVERSRDIRFTPSGIRWSPADPNLFMTFVIQDDGTKIARFSWKDRSYKVIGKTDENVDDARWSPDGKSIAYVSDHSGRAGLYVMNSDGTGEKKISDDLGYIESFNWLSDGSGFIVVVNRGGNDELLLLKGPQYKSEKIASGELYRINAPMLSPDGHKVVCFAYSDDYSESNLVIINLDTHRVTSLTQGANIVFVRWVDEQSLLFGQCDEDKEKTAIYRYQLS
ncbi:MAG TPA: hypothetical protein VHR47_03980 [Bacillota bacterium]|nr:hypothetical protein [Bacillota bacterium]